MSFDPLTPRPLTYCVHNSFNTLWLWLWFCLHRKKSKEVIDLRYDVIYCVLFLCLSWLTSWYPPKLTQLCISFQLDLIPPKGGVTQPCRGHPTIHHPLTCSANHLKIHDLNCRYYFLRALTRFCRRIEFLDLRVEQSRRQMEPIDEQQAVGHLRSTDGTQATDKVTEVYYIVWR